MPSIEVGPITVEAAVSINVKWTWGTTKYTPEKDKHAVCGVGGLPEADGPCKYSTVSTSFEGEIDFRTGFETEFGEGSPVKITPVLQVGLQVGLGGVLDHARALKTASEDAKRRKACLQCVNKEPARGFCNWRFHPRWTMEWDVVHHEDVWVPNTCTGSGTVTGAIPCSCQQNLPKNKADCEKVVDLINGQKVAGVFETQETACASIGDPHKEPERRH